MACCKKGNRGVQKVVIPKGMINPGETTIIEIPSNLQKQPIVVAKRKTSLDSLNNKRGSGKKCCRNKNSSKGPQAGPSNKMMQPYPSNGAGTKESTNGDLESTERKEREQFLRDLEEFQKARRKLLSNASFLAGEKTQFKKK